MRRTAAMALIALTALAVAVTLIRPDLPRTHSQVAGSVDMNSRPSDLIVESTATRLEVAPEVAYTKYRLGLSVEDPERERIAESAFVVAAAKRGIDEFLARGIIRDQMTASKMVQHRLINEWGLNPSPLRPYQELSALRNQIDAATNSLLDALAEALRAGIPADWRFEVSASVDAHAQRISEQVGREQLVAANHTISHMAVSTES